MQTGSDTSKGADPVSERTAASGWSRAARHALVSVRICLRSVEVFLWVVFFAAAAFFLGLRYWLLPNVERYRDDIVAAVSRGVGLKVSVETISADWRGLRPQIELVNVRLHDSQGREALLLPSVTNVVSWRSALFLNLRLHSFEVEDLKLSIRRDAQGAITVAGIPVSGGSPGDGSLADWVLAQKEIVIRNAEIEWVDELRNAPPLRLTQLNFRMANDDDTHAIGLSAHPPPALGSSIDLRAELFGHSVKQVRAWNGRVFAEVGNTDLAAWRAWLDYPVDVRSGLGAVRTWLTLDQGRLQRAVADVSLKNVAAQLGKDLPVLELSELQGRLSGRHTPKGFELATRALRFDTLRGNGMTPTTLRLTVEHPSGGALMKGAFTADQIEFSPLALVADSLPLPAELRKRLNALAPKGRLMDARLEWRGEPAAPSAFGVRSRFAGLAMKSSGRIPGFSGLTGSVEANEKKGTLYLVSKDAEVDLPRVFPESRVALESLTGQMGWEIGPQGGLPLQFSLTNLSFANPHVSGSAVGRYTWTGERAGNIDLSAQLNRGNAKFLWRYLPFVIGDNTRAWLSRAVLGGTASDVRLRLRGEVYDFPYVDRSKGEFHVSAKLSGATLDYAEGWPRMEGVDADLMFDRDRMEITGRKGRIFGANLSGVKASMSELGHSAPVLKLSGTAEGPSGDFLRYVQQSPVRRMIDGAIDGIQANSGRAQLKLGLELPLQESGKTKVNGALQFAANSLQVDPRLPAIERATGRVEFSESALQVREVRGALFGGNVAISGGTRPEGGVLVTARGEASVAGMRGFFDHPWKRFLSGTAAYTATVQAGARNTRVVFETGLRGVVSELPAPLAKPAQDTLPLRVEIVPTETGDRISLAVGGSPAAAGAAPGAPTAGTSAPATSGAPAAGTARPPLVNAEFMRRREGENTVVVRTGVGLNQPARLPERNGLLLSGNLPALNLDAWLPVALMADGSPPAAPAGTAALPATPFTASFDLRLGALDIYGKRISNVVMRAGADPRGWQANVTASEIAGDLGYRSEGRGKLTARLSYFTPPPDAPGARAASASVEYPAVDLVAERFSYRGKQLGRVEVIAQNEGANWRIERLASLNPEGVFTGKGLWTASTSAGGAARTALDFNLDVNDIGKYFDRIGYPETVRAGTAKLSGKLAWNGDPLNIDYPSLGGDLTLEAEGGQFLEIEPGIGKLVALMSMQMLPRRIALDFRDVFSKGFAFDRITSTAKIEKGVMKTRDFKMRGPAAEVDIDGDTDLARETQNLHVRVVPQLGDTASTVVGLLNPVAGLATMLAQRVLKNPLGQIFSFDYAITGTWTDPKVDKVSSQPAPAPSGPQVGPAPPPR